MVKLRLKEILIEKNLTQKDLALMTGLRPSTISDMVRNNRTCVNIKNLEKVCNVLNIKDIRKILVLDN